MKIVAFARLYNEAESGHLPRFLRNVASWADELVIYDDASTDASSSLYESCSIPTHVIHGPSREFDREQFHCFSLLDLALSRSPDWIVWMDGDTILERRLDRDGLRRVLSDATAAGHDGLRFHNVNLWRSPAWYRTDNSFNDLWPTCCWRNTGKLSFDPRGGLHGQLYPNGMENVQGWDYKLLHYGFASREWILRKWRTYRDHGQSGWSLDRLIDERGMSLAPSRAEWFPEANLPSEVEFEVCPVSDGFAEALRA